MRDDMKANRIQFFFFFFFLFFKYLSTVSRLTLGLHCDDSRAPMSGLMSEGRKKTFSHTHLPALSYSALMASYFKGYLLLFCVWPGLNLYRSVTGRVNHQRAPRSLWFDVFDLDPVIARWTLSPDPTTSTALAKWPNLHLTDH